MLHYASRLRIVESSTERLYHYAGPSTARYIGQSQRRRRQPPFRPRNRARVVKAARLGSDGPTGQFFSDDNSPETGIRLW